MKQKLIFAAGCLLLPPLIELVAMIIAFRMGLSQ